jgi:hypothetical protein
MTQRLRDRFRSCGASGVSFSAAGRLPHTALIYGGLLLTQYARGAAPSGATSTPRTPNATILT